jgi:S1-C subfamily serine protease
MTLSYFNSAGDKTELLRDVELAAGTLVLVPSEEDWFTLDGEPGPYNFVLETDSGHTVSQTVNLLPAAAPPISADLKADGEITWMPKEFPSQVKANLRSARDFKGSKITAPGDISLRGVAAELYKKAAPGVVVVFTGDAHGSGAIISQDGTILTNSHVIEGHNSAGIYFKRER